MIALFLLLIAAFAAEVRVITPDGDPVPGRTTRVHVAAVDDAGAPLLATPALPPQQVSLALRARQAPSPCARSTPAGSWCDGSAWW